VESTGVNTVLLAGGVAASQTLRQLLLTDKNLRGIRLIFSDPKYASDNAYGIAKLAERLSVNRSL
jgi:tRNA A37 threonylcarbamoyltransferase TsaD